VLESKEYLFQRWAIFIISIGMMLIIITLGVINSLMNDINNRRVEYALLRVLELEPKRIVKVIIIQVFPVRCL
jgi:putative ABC transport system permease protein